MYAVPMDAIRYVTAAPGVFLNIRMGKKITIAAQDAGPPTGYRNLFMENTSVGLP